MGQWIVWMVFARIEKFAEMRQRVGEDFMLMADCWMSLDVPYAVELAEAMKDVKLYWFERFCSHTILMVIEF